MKLLQGLREYLAPYAHTHLRNEPLCTCGDSNHVRLLPFRVSGLPAVLILPEWASLTPEQAQEALGGVPVSPLSEADLDSIYAMDDLGLAEPFSNPFGAAIYFDESLLLYPSLVFCPRMFGGREGECFRVPTRDLLAHTQPCILPLAPAPCIADEWAV